MTPPGRRKTTLTALISLLLLLLLTTHVSAGAAVLGIDLGTEYIKAAIAKPGSPIEVVLTKDSKRKEAATLAFKPSRAQSTDPEAFPERLYGSDAIALSARYPSDVYPNLKSLLGLARYSEQVKQYSARYPGLSLVSIPRLEDGNARGTVGFKSSNIGEKKEAFMVEELLAMELKNIKANAEAALGKGTYVTDVVVTYPGFYTAEEKRAIELAADFAGLRLLGLISDGLAVGLNYATTRTFDSVSEGAKPEYHLVYDMGAGSTTATVLKFQGRTVKDYGKRNKTIQETQVLGVGYDRTLGGDTLNDVIVKDMITQFVETPKMKQMGLEPSHIKSHAKTMAKLWKEAERIRQVLSANSLTSASFDGIYYDDAKFKYSLDRDQFERLVKIHASRVVLPITGALDAAGVTLHELDSIILHGGAVRTPFVQKQLEIIAGGSSKIKTNVNADEAAVMGAAFRAAALSSTFRVKEIRATDIAGTAFNLKWTSDGKEKNQKLFTPASQVGIEKQVPFKTLEDISFEFSQMTEEKEVPITTIEVLNLTKSAAELTNKHGCAPANISTVFNIRLNPSNGLPEIVSGSVSCVAEQAKAGVMDNVKGMFGFGSKKDSAQEPLDASDENAEDPLTQTPLPLSDRTSSGSTVSEASAEESRSSTSGTKSAKSSVATSTIVTIPLALKATILGLNQPPKTSLPRIRQRLTQFDSSDRNIVLRSEALNTLEAYTYRARDYLSDDSFVAVSTEKLRNELEKKISEASDWLYGDGVDAKLQDFKDKLKSLKALVDPVLKRKEESSGREAALKKLQDGLENMSSMIKMVEGSIEKAAQDAAARLSSAASSAVASVTPLAEASPSSDMDDLEEDPYVASATSSESVEGSELPTIKPYEYTQEDLGSMTKMYDSVKSWLAEKVAEQAKLKPYDDPVFLISELEVRAQQLQTTVSEVIMKTIKMQELPKRPKKSSGKKNKAKKAKGENSSTGSGASSTTASMKPTNNKDEL